MFSPLIVRCFFQHTLVAYGQSTSFFFLVKTKKRTLQKKTFKYILTKQTNTKTNLCTEVNTKAFIDIITRIQIKTCSFSRNIYICNNKSKNNNNNNKNTKHTYMHIHTQCVFVFMCIYLFVLLLLKIYENNIKINMNINTYLLTYFNKLYSTLSLPASVICSALRYV